MAEPKDSVTTIALLNLVHLLAAELVAGEHRDDVERLIRALDRKIDTTPLPRGIDVNDARAGLAEVKALLRPVVNHAHDLTPRSLRRGRLIGLLVPDQEPMAQQ
jgi:hypothetical protein